MAFFSIFSCDTSTFGNSMLLRKRMHTHIYTDVTCRTYQVRCLAILCMNLRNHRKDRNSCTKRPNIRRYTSGRHGEKLTIIDVPTQRIRSVHRGTVLTISARTENEIRVAAAALVVLRRALFGVSLFRGARLLGVVRPLWDGIAVAAWP